MEFKKLREQNVGSITEKVIQLKKNNGKITIKDVKNVREKFIKDGIKQYGKDNFDISLIKVNAGKWVTFTTEEKFNEYFENKVKDPTKFYEFNEVQFYVHFE